MKKTITLLLILISHFAFAQENEDAVKSVDSTELNQDFYILELLAGHSNQIARLDGNHLANQTSYALSLRAGFKTSSITYLKSGVDFLSEVALQDFNYTSYRIPILFGVQFNLRNSAFSHVSAFIDSGFYYRNTSIENKQASLSNIESNSTYGLQTNMGFQIPLSANLYAILLFNINVDFDEAIEIDDDEVQLLDTSLQIGLGYRF